MSRNITLAHSITIPAMIDGTKTPIVLCISGHDATGGAGIQADIETVAALGGHAITLITCLTVQNLSDVEQLVPTDAGLLERQLDTIAQDLPISAVKIGLLGNAEIAAVVQQVIATFAVPVVLDPVLWAGGGRELADNTLVCAIARLLPLTTLITPNHREARRLARQSDAVDAAQWLTLQGPAVLLTGADVATDSSVINLLFQNQKKTLSFSHARLPHSYHGSGCTLASACAFYLASGRGLESAVTEAQDFTQKSLCRARALGYGQLLPRRL